MNNLYTLSNHLGKANNVPEVFLIDMLKRFLSDSKYELSITLAQLKDMQFADTIYIVTDEGDEINIFKQYIFNK